MATREELRGLVLSASEIRAMTKWPSAMVEDYLNLLDNLITLANAVDDLIANKIEEIPTDFSDGSIPYTDSNLLVEDNTNFFWDSVTKALNALTIVTSGITLSSATASRLLATDGSKGIVSVANLAAWIAGTANEIDITDDGDGSITIGIVDPLIVGKGGTGTTALTDHGILLGSGTGAVTALAEATDGQIPIGSTGFDPVLATITGTVNQVTVTNAAGSITLSSPQDIATGSSPTFATVKLSGLTDGYVPYHVSDALGLANSVIYIDGTDVGVGVTAPTARLHLPAGTATANTAPIKFTSGTALTTPETGAIEFHDDRFWITNVNKRRVIDRTNDVIIATTEVVNTVTETTIYTGYIEANGLKVSNVLKLHACGQLTNNSASDDVTIRIYLGSTEVLSFSQAIGKVTDENWRIEGHMTVRTVGAGGTMAYSLVANIGSYDTVIAGVDSVDTTTAEDFTVTVEWDNAKADNSFKIFQGFTEWKS